MKLKDLQGKILVSIMQSDGVIVEKLVLLRDNAITVNNITYPINTTKPLKWVDVNDGCYIPGITIHGDSIIALNSLPSNGMEITDNNVFMRFFRLKSKGKNNAT